MIFASTCITRNDSQQQNLNYTRHLHEDYEQKQSKDSVTSLKQKQDELRKPTGSI